MRYSEGGASGFWFIFVLTLILSAVLCTGADAAAAGDLSDAGGYRDGLNQTPVNTVPPEDDALLPEATRGMGRVFNDRTGVVGSMDAMRRGLLTGNTTVILPYPEDDSEESLPVLQPDDTNETSGMNQTNQTIPEVQEPTPIIHTPQGTAVGSGDSGMTAFLNRYGIDLILLFVIVGILAAAGGALLYRVVAGKRHRTDAARNEDAAGAADDTIAVTSSWYSQSFPNEAAVMNSSLGSAYFPLPLTDRYQDVRFVGKGGVARVFCAKRRIDGEEVAVKVPISFDEVTGKMFLKEMRIWERLSHPNIVTLFSVNILPVPFVEMEYLPGSLAEKSLPLEPAEAIRIIRGIAEGIAYAHTNGIIHRDIKPQNILITGDGAPKISDWGLGTMLSDGHETTTFGFSLNYAAPEQVAPTRFGSPDERTDIYGVGVVFYECVTGVRPFSETGVAEMTAAILGSIPRAPSAFNPSLEPLDALILRCLEKNPDDRFTSADEMLEALDLAEIPYLPDAGNGV